MILHVPRETLVLGLTERLDIAGLGILPRKGEYTLVVKSEYPEAYPHFIDPVKPPKLKATEETE